MTDFIERLREQVSGRIDELAPIEDELRRLRAALDALDGVPTDLPSPPAAAGPVRGARQLQILELVSQHPGITVQQVAGRLRVEAPTLYPPVRRLLAGGHAVRRGRQLFLPD